MVEDNLIEGTLKYRDGKKWKQRWAVLNKLSPVADVLQLQLYRDSRDKARGAPTKASLALTNTLALITGFTLDKESHTLALLCRDLSIILAYESRERFLQWNAKLSSTFGNEQQFLVQLVQVPLKSRVPLGPSRMHVRNHRFCLTSGTPPRLLAAWSSVDVRRYGVVDGRFVWEGGTRCGRGAGIHVLLSDAPHDITRALDLAARGGLPSSLSRRSSATAASGSTLQRDAATWLREIGSLDLSKFSEAGDTTSLLTSEAGSILSPHGSCLSRNDLVSGHWSVDRRPSCTAQESYITGGSSSSSGSLTSEDPGWWANTWTSARGSLWEVTPPSPVPESLYDSPRSIIHQPCSFAAHTSTSTPNHHWCTQSLRLPKPHNQCYGGCQRLYVTPNPLDNYDVPRNHLLNYDTPRRIHTAQEKGGTFCQTELQSRSIDTCGKVLGWAGALMCRRQDTSFDYVEPVRLSGEGRMPVLDANTGTIIHPKSPTSATSSNSCSCSSQCSAKSGHCQELPVTERRLTSSLSSTPIYAVVDKSKKISKPRAPTPPPSPSLARPENKSNYANVTFSPSSKDLSLITKDKECSDVCNQCGGLVTPDGSLTDQDLTPTSQQEKQQDKKNEDADYLVMGPGSYTVPNSDYLCMDSTVVSASYTPKKSETPRPHYRPGRSLSLARRDRSPSPQRRRSSSADSRLHEPWETSQFTSPDPTPAATPLHSPPPSPFRTSTPQYESLGRGRGRGRPRKRISNREPRSNFSPSSVGSEGPETPPSEPVSQGTCPGHLTGGETLAILRRSSSVPVSKSANRDSASSSDSGVCESPRPSERILLSHCLHSSLPRGTRQKQQCHSNDLHQNAGATLGSCREIGPTGTVDAKSSSSGTSDISDYLDTLSMSSHSSSDHERLLGRASVTTLRPRSGREYSRLDRSALEASILPAVGEVPAQSITNN